MSSSEEEELASKKQRNENKTQQEAARSWKRLKGRALSVGRKATDVYEHILKICGKARPLTSRRSFVRTTFREEPPDEDLASPGEREEMKQPKPPKEEKKPREFTEILQYCREKFESGNNSPGRVKDSDGLYMVSLT